MTLEEDFALLLDFAELLLDFAELLLESSLRELDFAELLEATLDDERTELLDRSSTPSAELRAGSAEDDERMELLEATLDDERTLLDTLVSLSLDFGVTLLLDRSPDEPGMTEEEESSSSGRTKLLSSSQAAKNARANPSKKRFIQKILLRYVVYLANFPSSLHPVFIIFPAKRIEHDD